MSTPSKPSYIIGLNSGSSFDGIDVVLCSITLSSSDGHPNRPTYIDGLTVPWPDELAPQILRAFNNQLSIFELTRLNYAAGAVYADAANALLARQQKGDLSFLSPEDIDVVGYDGQTIYQEPPDRVKEAAYLDNNLSVEGKEEKRSLDLWLRGGYPCGLFIVESGVVASLTDMDVVTQFRPIDHALGGSGAPLMQYLDYVSFRHHHHSSPQTEEEEEEVIATLNIGGIANLQLVFPEREKMMAFDTGPGNVLIDHIAKVRTGRGFDEDGGLASRGREIGKLLEGDLMMGHPFFRRNPPRSAWKLDFDGDLVLDTSYGKEGSTEDLLATVTRFTARSIARSLGDFVVPRLAAEKKKNLVLVASGGGTRNKTLMRMLREEVVELLSSSSQRQGEGGEEEDKKINIRVTTSDEFGLPAAYKEAIKFAVLAFSAKRGIANNIPACGGAHRYAVLGKLSLAPRRARFGGGEVMERNEKVLGPVGWVGGE